MTINEKTGEVIGIPKWFWALLLATIAWAGNVTNQLSEVQVKLEYLSTNKGTVDAHSTLIEVLREKVEILNVRINDNNEKIRIIQSDVKELQQGKK